MTKIYVAHSKKFDFFNDLYLPLRKSHLNSKYEIILPHEKSDALFSSKEFFKNDCDVILVEASYPTIGAGIEAGWADVYDVPIITLCKVNFKLSSSIKSISRKIIEYDSPTDMISKLETVLKIYDFS